MLVAGLIAEGIWLTVCLLGPLREHTAAFVGLMLAEFALCAVTFFLFEIRTRVELITLLGFALLFRATLIPFPPSQSEDLYRYLWDARIAAQGGNPFAYPPEAPQLAPFRDGRVYPQINSKPYVTAYPPVSQFLFRLSCRLFGENITAMKAVFSLCEFGTVLIAWQILGLFGMDLRPLVLIAWNPFFIFEFSHSGHSDSAMMLCLLGSVYLLCRRRNSMAMIAYAGAVLSKLHPALVFPLYARRAGWKAVAAGAAAGGIVLLSYFDLMSAVRYIKSLTLYYRLFEFNAGIHYLLRLVGRVFFNQPWDKLIGPYLAVALVAATAAIVWKFPVRNELGLLHAAFWLMTADLCLSTTVHPWYLCWAAVALPLFPYAFMFYWTGAVFLSYVAYAYHPVFEPRWVLLIEYLPVYALMGWEMRQGRPMLLELASRARPAPARDKGGLNSSSEKA
jgi:alpha-1,6-mannosyltransferase